MSKAINDKAVREYLESQDIDYYCADGKYKFDISIQSRLNSVKAVVMPRETYIQVYAYCPLNCPEGVRAKMAEFLARANYGLISGNFEMDFDDGELRYKTHLHTGEDGPSHAGVERAVDLPILQMRRYGDGLVRILFDPAADAKACVEECEGLGGSSAGTPPAESSGQGEDLRNLLRELRGMLERNEPGEPGDANCPDCEEDDDDVLMADLLEQFDSLNRQEHAAGEEDA